MSKFVSQFLLESNEGKKYALIPWSYYPPFKEHYQFIKYYSDLVGNNGKVIIFIDKRAGFNKQILTIYLADLKNVIVSVAKKNAMESVKEFGTLAEKYNNNMDESMIVLASSTKQLEQMENIKEFYEKQYGDLYVIDPQSTICDVIENANPKKNLVDVREIVQFLPDHLSNEDKKKVALIIQHTIKKA